MPDSIKPGKSPGFGLNLVNILVKQINGTVTLMREKGTAYEITFPSKQ